MSARTLEGLPPSRYGAAPPLVRVGDVLDEAGARAVALGLTSVLLVTDAGVRAAGWASRVEASLRASGLSVVVWDGVAPEPTSAEVERAAAVAGRFDGVVSVGGGSVIDTGKVVALLRVEGGRIEAFGGVGRALPHLVAPTTAGTGSEVQSFALIRRADGSKMAVGSASLMPRVVLLDPAVVASCPTAVRVSAGLDALVHGVEAAVSTAASSESAAVAVEAFGRLWRALQEGDDAELAVGALLAGAAIEGGMLGAAHATGNALTAGYGTTHGLAVAMTLPHVVRWVCEERDVYGRLAAEVGVADGLALADAWEGLLRALGAPLRVEAGLGSDATLDALVGAARGQWTGRFSPRVVDDAGLRRILAEVMP